MEATTTSPSMSGWEWVVVRGNTGGRDVDLSTGAPPTAPACICPAPLFLHAVSRHPFEQRAKTLSIITLAKTTRNTPPSGAHSLLSGGQLNTHQCTHRRHQVGKISSDLQPSQLFDNAQAPSKAKVTHGSLEGFGFPDRPIIFRCSNDC